MCCVVNLKLNLVNTLFILKFVLALVSERSKQGDKEDLVKFSEDSIPRNTRKAIKNAVNQYCYKLILYLD